MAVTGILPASKTIDAKITALTTLKAALPSGVAQNYVATQLDLAQQEAVLHYIAIGRISAATILSTLS
jgi:hypothetical protein